MFCRFRIIILVWRKRKDRNGEENVIHRINIFHLASLDFACNNVDVVISYSILACFCSRW